MGTEKFQFRTDFEKERTYCPAETNPMGEVLL
jgi:hypothetical protein